MFNKARTVETIFLPNTFSERLGEQTLKQNHYHHPPPPLPISLVKTGKDLNCFQEKKNYALNNTRYLRRKENTGLVMNNWKWPFQITERKNKLSRGSGVATCGHLQHTHMQVQICRKCMQTEASQVFETALYNFFPRSVNTFGTISDQCVNKRRCYHINFYIKIQPSWTESAP